MLQGIAAAAKEHDIVLDVRNVSSLFGMSFVGDNSNTFFKAFFHAMLETGVYLAPSAFEAGFVSTAHDAQILAATITAAQRSVASISDMVAA